MQSFCVPRQWALTSAAEWTCFDRGGHGRQARDALGLTAKTLAQLKLPVVTASQVLPLDGEHFGALFHEMLSEQVKKSLNISLPAIVLYAIKAIVEQRAPSTVT